MSRLAGTIEEVRRWSLLALWPLFSQTISSQVRNQGESHLLIIKTLLSKLSILGDATHGEKLEEAENLKRKAYDFDPDEVAPEEVQQFLWHVLAWRDRFFKDILMGMEKIPGLSALLEEITDTLNACELSTTFFLSDIYIYKPVANALYSYIHGFRSYP